MNYDSFCDAVYKFVKSTKPGFSLRRIRFSSRESSELRAVLPTGASITGDRKSGKLTVHIGG